MSHFKKLGVNLAGAVVERSCHACAFFHTREEYYRVLLPFIKEGVDRGDKGFHVLDQKDHGDHLQRLTEADVGVAQAQQSGQLEVRPWEEAYLRPGYFNQDAMLTLIEGVFKEAHSKNYPMTRLVANMEWACKDLPGVKDIVKYETRLNHILPKYNDVVVCTYDLTRHSAGVVMDILRTHPMVIIGGTMQENPFFVSPDALLQELSQRAA